MGKSCKIDELAPLSQKTILITGAGGMLGSAFTEILSRHISGSKVFAYSHSELDVTDRQAVLALSRKKPDVVIHCAANVNANNCEKYPENCYAVQVLGTQNVIEMASKSKAKIFYPQSFLIFDGDQLPITEQSTPSPLSVYGKYKLEAEKLVLKAIPDSLIVRMAGFFGGLSKDKNFVGKFIYHIMSLDSKNSHALEIGNRVWQPTYTNDLAYNSLLLLAQEKNGIYNMACHGHASFFMLACEIVNNLGLNGVISIKEVSAEKFKKTEDALRPDKAVMINSRLIEEGLDRQRTWQESLREYIGHSYFTRQFDEHYFT